MRFDSPSNYGPAHFGPSIFEADDAPSASRPGQIKFINDLRDQYEEAKAQLARLTGAEYVATREHVVGGADENILRTAFAGRWK